MITVVDHDAAWADRFAQLRRVLGETLRAAGVPVVAIEHVGSTSVPGLAAKPVVDCDVVVAAPDVDAAVHGVGALGFTPLGDLGIADRYAFEPPREWEDVHLYVVVDGSLALRNHLAVRDVLRRDPSLRERYAAVKQELAGATDDIDVYTVGKSAVLQDVLAAGGLTADELARVEDANRAGAGGPVMLLTGMSGTGKSTLVGLLREHGVAAVDTDDGYVDVLADGTQRWRVDALRQLVGHPRTGPLVVAGCEEDMAELLDVFDLVVLLSVPREVLVERLRTRPTNPFGKAPGEVERVLRDLAEVEPRLRAVADVELVTDVPPEQALAALLALL